MTDDNPLLSVRELRKHYPIERGFFSRTKGSVKAVDGISFDVGRGETLGLVGESGCGKSTAARSIVRLEEPTSGEVLFNGGGRAGASRADDGSHPNDVTRFGRNELKAFRRDVQMIFQDPTSSFDPRMTVGAAVAEPLSVHGLSGRERRRAIVEDLLERVGLSAADYDRYPHEFSGGQKQRLALARALVLNPELLIADEPVSALDVSVQADILGLIEGIQEAFGLSVLFISHDLSVVRELCDRVAVMYLGEIVEVGPTEALFSDPQHPYTAALLSAIPTPDRRIDRREIELTGTVPDPSNPPSGCRFHTRCHEVVQPDGADLEQPVWRRVLTFRERVEAGEVDPGSIRQSVRTREQVAEGDADVPLEARVRAEFDLPGTLPDPTAERELAAAIEAVLDDDLDAAAKRLAATFSTPCEREPPEFTDHGDGHRSACLRHRPDVPTEPGG